MFQNVIYTQIASGEALSGVVDLSDCVGGVGLVKIPAAWTSAGLGFQAAESADGTFVPLRDQSGAIVEISGIQTAAAGWYKLPDELHGAMRVKLWSQTSGSNTNQGAARDLVIAVKG